MRSLWAGLLMVVATLGGMAPPASAVEPAVPSPVGQAYVWANDANAASYTVNTSYSYNSMGLANRIESEGSGVYIVELPGLGGSGGIAQATLYTDSAPSDGLCQVQQWAPDSSVPSQENVLVMCF